MEDSLSSELLRIRRKTVRPPPKNTDKVNTSAPISAVSLCPGALRLLSAEWCARFCAKRRDAIQTIRRGFRSAEVRRTGWIIIMNQLVAVFFCLAVGALLTDATDLKSCVRVACERCWSTPRLTRICPTKCASCFAAPKKNRTLAAARLNAAPIVALSDEKQTKLIPLPALERGRGRGRAISWKLIMPKSASAHLPNITAIENSTQDDNLFLSNATKTKVPLVISELQGQPVVATNSSATNESSSNGTVADSSPIELPILKAKNTTDAAFAVTKPTVELTGNATSVTAPRAKPIVNLTFPTLEINKFSADINSKSDNATNTTGADITGDSNTTSVSIVLVKKESYTGHGTPTSIVVGGEPINDEPHIRHEHRPHAQLNKFLKELNLPPVSEQEDSNHTASTKVLPLRRHRTSTLPPIIEEVDYINEVPAPGQAAPVILPPPPVQVAPVILSPPNTGVAPPPQPADPLSALFAPLRGTVLDPTNLFAAFTPATLAPPVVVAATLPPTLAPSDLSEFYIDEPSDIVSVDSKLPEDNRGRRIDGVDIDVNDKDISAPAVNGQGFSAIGKQDLRPQPQPQPVSVQQCPRLPGLEPCITKQDADARFLQCCAPLGVGCLPLCTYDASFTAIQVAVITGQCAVDKVATVLQCASGNEDATGCCQAKGVFEVGLEHCRPYCNPSGGLPTGQTSDNYRCLSKLKDIQYCFYASQRPRTIR